MPENNTLQFNIIHGHSIKLQPNLVLCDDDALEKSLNFRKLVKVDIYTNMLDRDERFTRVILNDKLLDVQYSSKVILQALDVLRVLDLTPEFYTLPDEKFYLVIKTTKGNLNLITNYREKL